VGMHGRRRRRTSAHARFEVSRLGDGRRDRQQCPNIVLNRMPNRAAHPSTACQLRLPLRFVIFVPSGARPHADLTGGPSLRGRSSGVNQIGAKESRKSIVRKSNTTPTTVCEPWRTEIRMSGDLRAFRYVMENSDLQTM